MAHIEAKTGYVSELQARIKHRLTLWREARAQAMMHRNAEAELSRYSDRELNDLGIAREDIPELVRGLI